LIDGLKRTGKWTELPMPRTVLLSEVAAALQFSEPTALAYLDTANGQIVAPTAIDSAASPHGFEPLPSFTEQHELELAARYAATVQNPEDRRRLQTALSSASPQEAFVTVQVSPPEPAATREGLARLSQHRLHRRRGWNSGLKLVDRIRQ
jgi:hypothetical protein